MKRNSETNGNSVRRKSVLIRMPADLLNELDGWIESQPVPPSRNAAILAAIRSWIEQNR